MFNVEPPSNVYSEEPSKDITFGVDNPSYVGMTELADMNVINKVDNEEGGNHYEIIDIAQNVENIKDEDKSPETLSNLNIEIMDIDLNFVKEETKALTNEIFVEAANELLETQTPQNVDSDDKENIVDTVEDIIEKEDMISDTLMEDVNINVSETDTEVKDDSSNEKVDEDAETLLTLESLSNEDVAAEASDNIIQQEVTETTSDVNKEESSNNLLDI